MSFFDLFKNFDIFTLLQLFDTDFLCILFFIYFLHWRWTLKIYDIKNAVFTFQYFFLESWWIVPLVNSPVDDFSCWRTVLLLLRWCIVPLMNCPVGELPAVDLSVDVLFVDDVGWRGWICVAYPDFYLIYLSASLFNHFGLIFAGDIGKLELSSVILIGTRVETRKYLSWVPGLLLKLCAFSGLNSSI